MAGPSLRSSRPTLFIYSTFVLLERLLLYHAFDERADASVRQQAVSWVRDIRVKHGEIGQLVLSDVLVLVMCDYKRETKYQIDDYAHFQRAFTSIDRSPLVVFTPSFVHARLSRGDVLRL